MCVSVFLLYAIWFGLSGWQAAGQGRFAALARRFHLRGCDGGCCSRAVAALPLSKSIEKARSPVRQADGREDESLGCLTLVSPNLSYKELGDSFASIVGRDSVVHCRIVERGGVSMLCLRRVWSRVNPPRRRGPSALGATTCLSTMRVCLGSSQRRPCAGHRPCPSNR